MRSKVLLLTSAVLCASNVTANAVSWSTQMNCASDYYAYCSMHTAGSAGCHACMRANRPKLSSSCVSALIDDGVLPKADVAQRKTKIAVTTGRAKAASRIAVRPVANPAAKAPPASVGAVKETPEAASPIAKDGLAARPETLARAAEPLVSPPQQPASALPAIDQQTIEALKNRAPYFLPTEDIASMFALIEENASTQPSSAPR